MDYLVVIILGLIIGSFLNCLIWRLYKDESLMGRSYCPKCRHQIAWYDNFPVLSFILLKARCRHCHQSISWQYPVVEIVTALLFLLSFHVELNQAQFSFLILRDWLLISGLIVIFVYDLRWQLVPMMLVWPMIVVMFIVNLLLGIIWWQIIVLAVVGASFFLIQYLVTKKKGVGEGDIWLGLLLGISFPSFAQFLLLIILAYGLGSLISFGLLMLKQKGWKSKVALGPFLAGAAIITLFWGERIINWYLQLM